MGVAPYLRGTNMATKKTNNTPKFSKIEIDYEGETYTLRYDNATILEMESKGVTAQKISDEAGSLTLTGMEWLLENLIVPAFKLDQPEVTSEQVHEIWDGLDGKDELLGALVELFMQPIIAITTNPTETRAKFRLV